jgi:DNA-directed RNA polymerase specialized sigma24 family protein
VDFVGSAVGYSRYNPEGGLVGVGGNEEVGEVPAALQRTALQPPCPADVWTEQRLPQMDILATIAQASTVDSQRPVDNAERRHADQALIAALALEGFAGPRYERFENELARYGISVLCGWMLSGYIFQRTTTLGFALHPTDHELEELYRQRDSREALASMTVALTLPDFRDRALIGGGWRVDGGASLSTYFVRACLYVFPNEYRRWCRQRERWRRQDSLDQALTTSRADHAADPAAVTLAVKHVRDHLADLPSPTRELVALHLDGYTHAEIAELLGERSARAVEGKLHRWRTEQQRRSGMEVDSDE